MATINLDRTTVRQPLTVALGDTVVVSLDETPTSGYRWEVAGSDPAVLQLTDDEFIPAADAALGGGGKRVLQFSVTGPGQSDLRLICRRSWESETDAVDAFTATVISTE